jgi:hypothetical protein
LLSLFIEDLMQEPIHLRVVQDPVEVRAAE